MVLKSYFDGSNQADSSHYDRISIATVCGTSKQWKRFDTAWRKILYKHKADYLHTTDAVSFQKDFAVEKGWNRTRVDSFIGDLVCVVRSHVATFAGDPSGLAKPGLLPVTLTVPFDDWLRAKRDVPEIPDTIEDICARESTAFALKWGRYIGCKKYQLFFDQGEPFCGYISNTWKHPKAQRDVELMKDIIHVGEADSRYVPALQMADLFGWCVNRANQETRLWHVRLHDLIWQSRLLDYEHLIKPNPDALKRIESWKLPPRRSSIKNLSKPKIERNRGT